MRADIAKTDMEFKERQLMARGLAMCETEFKAVDGEEGIVEGLASTWQLDLQDDQIHKGAFTKTINERVPAGRVKFLDSHRWSCGTTLGTIVEAEETAKGLRFRAKLSAAPSVQDTRIKMIEGHIQYTSIGFDPIRAEWEIIDVGNGTKKYVRHLREVKLWEISPVPIPANEGARIQSVKGLLNMKSFDEIFMQAVIGQPNTDDIKVAIKALAEHLKMDTHQLVDFFKSLTPPVEPSNPETAEPADSPLTVADSETVKSLMAQFTQLERSLNA